jgi:HIT zinc finger
MGEGADALLSELCAICHTNPQRYKCPRCGIQTCSLPCVKRHKLWSQCSGVRSPAAYRKRNELATPASVDQDYNFITSVERSVARAGDEAAERGIKLNTDEGQEVVRGQRRTNIEIANSEAIVLKAPEGMSRNKQNKSRWNMRGRYFSWTIEWVLPDGSKSLAYVQALRTVGEAFMHSVGGKALRKRKWTDEDAVTQPQEKDLVQEPQDESGRKTGKDCLDRPTLKEARPANNLPSDLHFYLHCPNTPSAIKSIIPIKPDATIADIVKERLLLEFPTIFILYEPPQMLSKPFILEADYAKQYGDQASSILSTDEANGTTEEQDQAPSQIDEKRLLEVLQKDLVS